MGLKRKEFALVYDPFHNNGLHSVYVESYNQQVKKVTCINSWGMVDPNPELDLIDIDSLYRVNCSTVDIDATQQSKTCNIDSLSPNSKSSVKSKL